MFVDQPFTVSLGALYGPITLHSLPASVHRTVVNALLANAKTPPSGAVIGIYKD
jgi:hypothetical protein